MNKIIIEQTVPKIGKVTLEVNNECPICHVVIYPKLLKVFPVSDQSLEDFIGLYLCKNCNKIFSVLYENAAYNQYGNNLYACDSEYTPFQPKIQSLPGEFNIPAFDKFRNAYRSASLAETYAINGLIETGYRRALEFLIRDYFCYIDEKHIEENSNLPFSKLIEKIEDNTIKELAQKIQWIGNDGAHYINFHTDRNYTDMKKFLNIVIAEIQKQLIILDAQSIKHKNK